MQLCVVNTERWFSVNMNVEEIGERYNSVLRSKIGR